MGKGISESELNSKGFGMKKYNDVVCVNWVDSVGVNSDWRSLEVCEDWRPAEMFSVGVLLAPKWLREATYYDEAIANRKAAFGDVVLSEAVVIAPHVARSRSAPDGVQRDCCGVMAVPLGVVKRVWPAGGQGNMEVLEK